MTDEVFTLSDLRQVSVRYTSNFWVLAKYRTCNFKVKTTMVVWKFLALNTRQETCNFEISVLYPPLLRSALAQ